MTPISWSGDDVYAVILAGGSGTRFWPKSRHLTPKQLTRVGGQKETMIEATLRRLDGLIPTERRIVVTHKDQVPKTREIVGTLASRIIGEPDARNTANALGLAALEIQAMAPKGSRPVMISLHADHVIQNVESFRESLKKATFLARQGLLTLIGVVPDSPQTGFGYIEKGAPIDGGPDLFKVHSFREKPDLETAKKFIATKNFFWNTGYFIWQTSTILEELERTLPVTVSLLKECLGAKASFQDVSPAALQSAYQQLPKISVDHAILETSKRVALVTANFGWQDIGSWSGLTSAFPGDDQGNLVFGNACLIDSTGTTIDSDGPLVAALGLKDMVVVAHAGAILVCPKSKDQDVKQIVEWLKTHGRSDLV